MGEERWKMNSDLSFSQRNGYAPVRTELQTDDIDDETRIRIWNYLQSFFRDCGDESGMYKDIWSDLLGQTIDNPPKSYYNYYRELVLKAPWYEVFNLLEYLDAPTNRNRWITNLTPAFSSRLSHRKLPSCIELNIIFEQTLLGWRLVNHRFIKTTDDLEIKTIEEATRAKCPNVRDHIEKALHYLADRNFPDYANSFKESISAVEAQCNLLAGSGKAILTTALSVLAKKGTIIHPALIEALKKLYSYSSDSVGVRHGNIGESDVDGEMAKFMLVICSSFVNYLRSKTPKA